MTGTEDQERTESGASAPKREVLETSVGSGTEGGEGGPVEVARLDGAPVPRRTYQKS